VLRFEFTVEPFVEGQPGPHVMSAVAAAESFGVAVDFGPFGSTCLIPADQAGEASRAIIAAAFANGASHINLDVTREDDVEPANQPGGRD